MKFRLYVVSAMAVLAEQDENGGTIIRWKHMPALYMAPDIDSAIAQAEQHIWNVYPITEGYTQHHLTVEVVPKSFFDGLNAYVSGGLLSTENDLSEAPMDVYPSPPTVTPKIESDISGNIH